MTQSTLTYDTLYLVIRDTLLCPNMNSDVVLILSRQSTDRRMPRQPTSPSSSVFYQKQPVQADGQHIDLMSQPA